jgi:hypothetical protein
MTAWNVERVKRVLRKSPKYLLHRLAQEAAAQSERIRLPLRARHLSLVSLAERIGLNSSEKLWDYLSTRPGLAIFPKSTEISRYHRTSEAVVRARAQDALEHVVEFLGTGRISLGGDIDWHCDFKSGQRWSRAFYKDIVYGQPDQRSDVKIPWELSRLQWVIPLGQAYCFERKEEYAEGAKQIVTSWILANPIGWTVNWACTMDVALRLISLTILFDAFKDAPSWRDESFRSLFLRSLYLHGDFTARNLEQSDVNGNHLTADAVGLVAAGVFWGAIGDGRSWLQRGWDLLCTEIGRQVYDDGVDFEGSVPYHRLVTELFLVASILIARDAGVIPGAYQQKLIRMAQFVAAYSRTDGTTPFLGDADDARVAPFGGQPLHDHRYLIGLVGLFFNDAELCSRFSGSLDEITWILGEDAAERIAATAPVYSDECGYFPSGGIFVLRSDLDHVFIDNGPIGLGGRGGHGHNDALSFEAVLNNCHLVTDSGSFLYTSDYIERNLFRSTRSHNTPQIDDAEINRFVSPNHLWSLHDDAKVEVISKSLVGNLVSLSVAHTGYMRLAEPVRVIRHFELNRRTHRLVVVDDFVGEGYHTVVIPLHLAPNVSISQVTDGAALLTKHDCSFILRWSRSEQWQFHQVPARQAPSYGVAVPIICLRWSRTGPLESFRMEIYPTNPNACCLWTGGA